MSLSFLNFYENEMNYLIEEGKRFKEKYPSMCDLDFSNTSTDPDIKRLIESVAFLNASLNQRIEQKNPELNQEILNNIYPYFNRPTPSFCIFHINDPQKALIINKNTKIISEIKNNVQYTFLSSHTISVSSYKIKTIKQTTADIFPKDIAKKAEGAIEISLEKIFYQNENEMILFINNIDEFPDSLYESLFTFYTNKNTPVFEKDEQIGEIVDMDDFDILPTNSNESTTYKPIIEFNAFKQKFLFFKIKFTKDPIKTINIPIKNIKKLDIKNNSFLLNCFVAVNLVEKISEPIFIDNTKHKYQIKIPKGFDIYDIKSIQSIEYDNHKYINYFSLDYINKTENDILWITKKEETAHIKTNLYLLNNDFAKQTLFAKTLCVQKNANNDIDNFETWSMPELSLSCINIKKPTKYCSKINKEEAQRILVSHLFINYFGLDNENLLAKLKELFGLYKINENIGFQFSCIKSISTETHMIPMKGNMVPKIYIIMRVKDDPNVFLLTKALANLLSNNLNMNNKLALTLIKDETNEVWKQCNLV